MISDYGFKDIFRLTRGADKLYTHFNKQHGTASRLDFVLIDDNLINFPICTTNVSHGYKSDHTYVSLNIQGSSIVQGKGYWKFTNSHLFHEDFSTETKSIIHETINSSFDSYRGLWDTIKFKVKDHATRYGAKQKRVTALEKSKIKK